MIVLAAECFVVRSLGLTNAPLIIFTIGPVWLISALVNDIVTDLNNLNMQNETDMRMNANKYFSNVVKHFADTKELSEILLFEIGRHENGFILSTF